MLKLAASPHPWRCTVLAVDPGESCGVAVWTGGEYVSSGVCDGYFSSEIVGWLGVAQRAAMEANLPLVLVMEKPPMGGRAYRGRNLYGSASVMGSRKVWAKVWGASVYTVSSRVVNVLPQVWRSRVLGVTGGPLLESREVAAARRFAGREMQQRDEAAAVCIGCWASHAGEVGAKLRGRRNGKAG